MNSSNTSFTAAWDINGQTVPYTEPWGQLGAYTTLRMEVDKQGARVCFPAAHLERLTGDLSALGIDPPAALLSRDTLVARIRQCPAHRKAGHWLLRFAVMSETASLAARPVPATATEPLTGRTQIYRRSHPQIKSLDYAELIKRMEPLDRSREELVLKDPDGRLLEGATTNLLFWHEDGYWIVPDRDCLPGITRELLLPFLKKTAMVRFTDISPAKLDRISAILCCGSGREVAAFARLAPFGWEARTFEPLEPLLQAYQQLKATTHDRLCIDPESPPAP